MHQRPISEKSVVQGISFLSMYKDNKQNIIMEREMLCLYSQVYVTVILDMSHIINDTM